MTRRAYCRCTSVRNYGYDDAAEKLGCARRWLEDHIAQLPHQKYGKNPVFCDCELLLIQAMFTVLPDGVLDLLAVNDRQEEPAGEKPKRSLTLAEIRPSGAHRARAM